ncbi:hypothetical protein SDC9_181924 [bioreactor metagenome]|uniref:Uncharacterized protein n=1 Tax=bioreactor metagenome TaxID=1076179 RepID=A0A645H5Y0_9ZZZZ
MNAGRSDADERVADADVLAIHDTALVRKPNTETCQVIFINRIKTRHLGGFTANECTTRLYTPFCYTGYNFCHAFGLILAYGKIVQEEQRLGTRTSHIIGAHGDTVNPYGIVFVHQKRDF